PLLRCAADDEIIAIFHPRIRLFLLETLLKRLTEKPVAVQQAIAGDGVVGGYRRVEKARRQTPQTTIAEGSIGFGLKDIDKFVAGIFHDRLGLIHQFKVGEVIQKRTTLQEFGRKIVLLTTLSIGLFGLFPIV